MVALVRAYGGASPDQLSCDQVQAFIANLVGEKKRAWSTVNVYVSACRDPQDARRAAATLAAGNGSEHLEPVSCGDEAVGLSVTDKV